MSTQDRAGPSVIHVPGMPRLTLTLLLSNSADQFAMLALVWFVLQRTSSAIMMGAVVVCASAPALITAPWAGALLDRRRPQTLIAIDNAARALCLVTIPLLYWLHALSIPILFTLAVLTGMLAPLTYSGTRLLVPRLVPAHALPAANGFLSIGDQIPYLLGPATGGVIVARIGGPASLLVPAGALILAAVLALGVTTTGSSRVPPRPGRIRDGMNQLWRIPALRALTVLTVTYYFAYGPLEPALPMYVKNDLHAGAGAYGLM
jgi:hypothetical protein